MIEEIPISENSEISVEAEAPPQREPVEDAPEPVKRGRGRPKGKAKPKADHLRVETNHPRQTPEIEDEPPTPRPKTKRAPRARPEPEYEEEPPAPVYDPRQIAAEVLGILSNRHVERRQQRRDKYASWFANPAY
jgi:hypothetical protein